MRTKLLALALLPAVCWAQGSPVTRAEADAVLNKVDAAIRTVLKMKATAPKNSKDDAPITRAEVVARLDAMFEAYRPHVQYTPRPFRTDTAVIARANKGAATRKSMEKLSRWGCIAPVGPLVVGPGNALTTAQFGDAVGFFMSQIAALTYFADPKWVPNLGGGGL